MTTRLTLLDVQKVAFELACEELAVDEPIPPFETRFPGRLEACLEIPPQTFGGYSPYKTLAYKAAFLFYLLIKDHPFRNGNKRIALTSLLVFLFLNERWLETSWQDLYRLAKNVAESQANAKDLIVMGVSGFIDKRLVRRDSSSTAS